MGLEHFAAGAGESAHLLRNPLKVTMLGVTGNLHPRDDQRFISQLAEEYWGSQVPAASKTISEQGARDLVGEAIHHPNMDEIPGIESIRMGFNPTSHLQLSDELPEGVLGQVARRIDGQQTMTLGHTPDYPLRTNIVTHELSHLLSSPTLYPAMQLAWNKHWENADKRGEIHDEDAADNLSDSVSHSWPHARAHIHAVRTALGNEAADVLRNIYRAHGVSFGKRNI